MSVILPAKQVMVALAGCVLARFGTPACAQDIPGTRSYSDIERNPDNEAVPNAVVFRVEASLLYFLARGTAGGGIRLRLVAAHATVRDILRAERLDELVGHFDRRLSVADVIDEFQGKTGTS